MLAAGWPVRCKAAAPPAGRQLLLRVKHIRRHAAATEVQHPAVQHQQQVDDKFIFKSRPASRCMPCGVRCVCRLRRQVAHRCAGLLQMKACPVCVKRLMVSPQESIVISVDPALVLASAQRRRHERGNHAAAAGSQERCCVPAGVQCSSERQGNSSGRGQAQHQERAQAHLPVRQDCGSGGDEAGAVPERGGPQHRWLPHHGKQHGRALLLRA